MLQAQDGRDFALQPPPIVTAEYDNWRSAASETTRGGGGAGEIRTRERVTPVTAFPVRTPETKPRRLRFIDQEELDPWPGLAWRSRTTNRLDGEEEADGETTR